MIDVCKPEFFRGYLNWCQEEDGVSIQRLPESLLRWYEAQSEAWDLRANCTPGVRLDIETDAQEIWFSMKVTGEVRPIAGFGLVIDGQVQPVVSFQPEQLREPVCIHLDGNWHHVVIYLPHLIRFQLLKAWAIGGSRVEASKETRKTYYAFGDSITQGFVGEDPAQCYPSRLSREFDLDLFNFGVGGIRFLPETLTGIEELPKPDMITIALGTNDWSVGETENMSSFLKGCAAYFKQINACYPGVPTYVILPLWRREEHVSYKRGSLQNIRDNIARVAAFYPHMKLIDGTTLILADERYFADTVHPNHQGFLLLGEHLCQAIKQLQE